MGKMKANRKFVEGEEAVSAVIGVILMVAITVAIAATVYVYVSGMVTPESSSKTISAIQDSVDTTGHNATYKVTDADAGIDWSLVSASTAAGSATLTDINGAAFTSGNNVEVGEYFILEVSTAGTYSFDLIFSGDIIWTSPDVAL